METRGLFKQKKQCVQRFEISFALDFISLLSLRHMPNNLEEAPKKVLRKGRKVILKLQVRRNHQKRYHCSVGKWTQHRAPVNVDILYISRPEICTLCMGKWNAHIQLISNVEFGQIFLKTFITKYAFSAYCMSGTILGTGATPVSKMESLPPWSTPTFRETDANQ